MMDPIYPDLNIKDRIEETLKTEMLIYKKALDEVKLISIIKFIGVSLIINYLPFLINEGVHSESLSTCIS